MFKGKNKNFIGVDIGDKYLKLSSLSKIEDVFSVDSYAKIDISEYVNEGQILNPKKIQEFIIEYIQEYNIIKPELIFAFPNKNLEFSQTKIFKMKTLSKKDEMKSAIEIEVEDRYNNSDDKMEWEILSSDFNSETLVYSTIYKEEKVKEYEEIMKDLKYSYSIIPKNAFLNNVINSTDKSVLLVDIGYNTTDLIVYHNNYPLVVKTINIGGHSITDIISSFKSISYEDAEKVKIEEGLLIRDDSPIEFSYEERELSSFIDTQIQIITNDIERLSSDLISEFGLSLDEIKVCGGSSNIKYLPSYFESVLQIPTEKLTPVFLEDNKNEEIIEISSTFVNSFGASFLSFGKPTVKLSFKNIKQENEKLPYIVSGIALFIVLLITSVSVCGNIVSGLYLDKTSDKLSVVKTEYAPFESMMNQYKNIINSSGEVLNQVNEITNVLDTIERNRILPVDVLTKLKTHTPRNVQIDTFSFSNKTIEIEGVVSDYMTLGYFIKELELVDEFSKIDFEYANIYTEVKGSNGKTLKNLKYKITISYEKTTAPINEIENNSETMEE